MTPDTLRGNKPTETVAARVRRLLKSHGMMRAVELRREGVTPSTLSRLADAGEIVRLGRGLYQLADAEVDLQHDIATAAKRAPKGVICLESAIAFHGLTDHMPRRVWMAIGLKDWAPRLDRPPLHIMRMSARLLELEVEHHVVDNVPVKVFSPARSIIDAFRHERTVGRNLGIESLREALRQKAVTPAAISDLAIRLGAWTKLRPYLETLTSDA